MIPKQLETLYNEVSNQLYAYACRYLGSPADAEDVMQETLIALVRRGKHEDLAPTEAKRYLLGILRNKVREYSRRKQRESAAAPAPEPAQSESPAASLVSQEFSKQLKEALARLPKGQRDSVTMCYLKGMTQQEVANTLGLSVYAIRSHLRRARESLRSSLSALPEVQEALSGAEEGLGRGVGPTETQPAVIVVWDPELMSESEYAALVNAIGDLVRAEGGVGVERIRSSGFGVALPEGALI